jgi:hypothetical protein
MAAREGFARLRRVLVVMSILWLIACAALFWSVGNHTPVVFFFLLIVAVAPVAAAWGLLWVIEGFMLKKEP